ncbi:MAG: electron transport complex subunit E [Clostridia bacterium]|nr:electron transport complex subunit E [Clostridia bacterium]
MKKNSNWGVLTRGILKENPVLVLILGTCPTLAMTDSVIKALGMGVAVIAVLVCSNIFISLLRNLIPETMRIPCYIVIIAGFVTLVDLLMEAYLPSVHESLGSFLKLITVNCIILGRAEMFAGKNPVLKSALDGVGMGVGFTIALTVMSTFREVLGNASFAGIEIPFLAPYKIAFMTEAPGGLLTYGLTIALMYAVTHGKAPLRKSFSCAGCPNAGNCHTGTCTEKGAE